MFRDLESTLKYIVYPFPIWWFLGLEQILIWILGAYALLNFFFRKKKYLKYYDLFLVAFFLVTFISMIFVSSPSRLFEFIRSTIAFSLVIFGSLAFGEIIKRKGRERILEYAFIIYLWSVFSAVIGFFLPDFTINAPINYIIPGFLKEFALVENLYVKNLGDFYYSIFGQFWRPSGFYAYSTGLSNTLVLLLPLALLHRYYHYSNKKLIDLSIVLGILTIFLTTTRMAVIVLVILAIYLGLFVYKKFRMPILIASVFGFITFLYFVDIVGIYNTFMDIRGGGSLDFRLKLYLTTLEYFSVKPIFGWGAQIPHPEFYAALGSHSGYLNTLLCYGVVGFTLFYGGLISSIYQLRFNQHKDLLILGSWLVFFLISFTQVFHTDFITVLVVAILLAITTTKDNLKSFNVKLV